MKEIYPSKVYVVEIRDLYGNFKKLLKNPYPQNSTAYYDTMKEAKEDIDYRKKHKSYEFEHDDKISIKAVPFSDAYPGIYDSKLGVSKRYTSKQIKDIIANRDESHSYGPPYKYFPYVTDELEGKDEYEIFMDAIGHDTSKPGAIERGMKAIKEYREGIEDRKKKTSKPKPKRKIVKKPVKKVVKKCKCK